VRVPWKKYRRLHRRNDEFNRFQSVFFSLFWPILKIRQKWNISRRKLLKFEHFSFIAARTNIYTSPAEVRECFETFKVLIWFKKHLKYWEQVSGFEPCSVNVFETVSSLNIDPNSPYFIICHFLMVWLDSNPRSQDWWMSALPLRWSKNSHLIEVVDFSEAIFHLKSQTEN